MKTLEVFQAVFGREVEEVGHGCDYGSNLVGTGKARRQDMIVACAGSTGLGEHADEHPVAYGELGVAAVAIGLGDAFLGSIGEGCTGGVPVFLHTVEEGLAGLIEGVLRHLGVLDIGEKSRLVSEVEVVG